MFQQKDKLIKAKNTKPYLQNILSNLEEKQISDQKVFMRKVNSAQKGGHYCPSCLLSFDSPKSLNKHNEEHFTKRNYYIQCLTPKIDCPLCKKTFFQKSSFQNHLTDKYHVNSSLMQPRVFVKKPPIAQPQQSLKCSTCTKKFLKSSIFEKHKLFHRTTSLYECPNCFKSFDSLKKVTNHKSIHLTKEKKFECFSCKKEFSKYFSLLSHFQSKICKWNKKCKQKQISFPAQENKIEPTDTILKEGVHSNLISIRDEFLTLGSYEAYPIKVVNSHDVTCSVCQARFTAPTPSRIMDSFNNHAKFHTRLYPFECPYCYMGYHSLLEMKIHKRNHLLNETKYTCTVCSSVFENFSLFRRHLEESGHRNVFKNDLMPKESILSDGDSSSDFEIECKTASNTTMNIISPKRKYECPLCQTSLGCNSEAFSTHIKLHQTLTSNVCQYCFKELGSKDDVQNHLEIHHEDKLYKCPYDDFVTENHSSLLLHFELEGHKSCNNDTLNNLKVNELENKSYGQDKGLELGKNFNKNCEIESFDQVITEVHSNETEQGETKTLKKINNTNIFSALYKSSERKKCEICSMELEGERSLKSHQKTHLTGFPLECSQCLMGFEDEYKLKKHKKQHQDFFECLNCSEEFETYVRFLKHLEDTNHNNAYKDSYTLHSELIHKNLDAKPLVDMFPEQEDLEFDCSKAVNFVLDDELHDLSDKDQNEKKGCKIDSNNTFSVEQIQLDFESSDSDDTNEILSRSNIEHFCNTELDENETKPFCQNAWENKLVLSSKISSILTDAGSVLSCEKDTDDFGNKYPAKIITTCFRMDNEHKLSEKENAIQEGHFEQKTILSDAMNSEEKHEETVQTLSLDGPSHSTTLNTATMENDANIEGQYTNYVEIHNTQLEETNRNTNGFPMNIVEKDNELFDGESKKEKGECLSDSLTESEISFPAFEKKDYDHKNKWGDEVLNVKHDDEKHTEGIGIGSNKHVTQVEVNETSHPSKGCKIESKNDIAETPSLNRKIPIYKQAFLEPSHQEFFSDKFVNRNMLLKKSHIASQKFKKKPSQNEERKYIERRKFGSLNTKFQGRKKITSNILFSKDDPFSIETEEPAVSSTSTQDNLTMSENKSHGVVNVAGPIFQPCNQDMQSCVDIEEKKDKSFKTNNKKKSLKHGKNVKIKKNKKEDICKTSIIGIEPSCPFCFKILLNQEKMKLHMDQCKKNQETTQTTNLKFKIKLQSDSKNILEKIK